MSNYHSLAIHQDEDGTYQISDRYGRPIEVDNPDLPGKTKYIAKELNLGGLIKAINDIYLESINRIKKFPSIGESLIPDIYRGNCTKNVRITALMESKKSFQLTLEELCRQVRENERKSKSLDQIKSIAGRAEIKSG